MSYIDEILGRMHIQQYCAFLREGVEDDVDGRSYEERITAALEPLKNRIYELVSDWDARDDAMALVYAVMTAGESVYMELGFRAGMRLAGQL